MQTCARSRSRIYRRRRSQTLQEPRVHSRQPRSSDRQRYVERRARCGQGRSILRIVCLYGCYRRARQTMKPASLPAGEIVSHNQRETFELGVRIGEALRGGEILLLSGPLGAGKTVLVKGIARALAVDEEDVRSEEHTSELQSR